LRHLFVEENDFEHWRNTDSWIHFWMQQCGMTFVRANGSASSLWSSERQEDYRLWVGI